ncbi:tetratricopeptide repeat protein [Negadavirga shengliensis]|uniref:Tetratricopeptide repeat protein n=1 Tax=Negadavirga shengliensis TaxID=1389218 RepID=A0ABV9T9K0_9BACT
MLLSKYILVVLLFLPSSWKQIAQKNQTIREAERAYAETDFEASVRQHLALISEHDMNTPQARFNLALSYQNNGQEEEAKKTYEELIRASHPHIPSFAANQHGVLLGRDEAYREALSYFKTALLKNPDNEVARYNYELLARWLEQNQDEQQDEKSDQEDSIQPSNYAKRMKAQADEMVDQFRFREALEIMNRALEIDETVSYYQGFINNLGDINEIDAN